MSDLPPPFTQPPAPNVQLRYDTSKVAYASQVILNTSVEEVYLDFSPGLINDPAGGASILPITDRIAMNPNAVLRLYQALGQALQAYQAPPPPPAS